MKQIVKGNSQVIRVRIKNEKTWLNFESVSDLKVALLNTNMNKKTDLMVNDDYTVSGDTLTVLVNHGHTANLGRFRLMVSFVIGSHTVALEPFVFAVIRPRQSDLQNGAYGGWNTEFEYDMEISVGQGEAGAAGVAGSDGKSAYQIWLDAGNTGTETNFLTSLKGEKGETGAAGTDGHTPKKGVDYFTDLEKNEVADLAASKVTPKYRTYDTIAQRDSDTKVEDGFMCTVKVGESAMNIITTYNEGDAPTKLGIDTTVVPDVSTDKLLKVFPNGNSSYTNTIGVYEVKAGKIYAGLSSNGRVIYDNGWQTSTISNFFTQLNRLILLLGNLGDLSECGNLDWLLMSKSDNYVQYVRENGIWVRKDMDGTGGGAGMSGADGKSAYQIWLDAGNTGTETDFLTSLKGEKGDTGAAGEKGDTGEKGETGEAGANGSDGADGSDGKSAYQIWLDAGNTGTEADFLTSLKGEKGDAGAAGEKGDTGEKGNTGAAGENGSDGADGSDGKSAYQIWLDAGNTGTETAFLTSLKGEKGDTGAAGEKGDTGEKGETGEAGANGSDGADGSDGKSAYQIWLDAGNTGTEADFLTSLKGEKGDAGAAGEKGDTGEKGETGEAGANGSDGADGSDGKSAYQIWLDAGNTGTEADFLTSLKGEKGDAGAAGEKGDTGEKGNTGAAGENGSDGADGSDGKSAYQIWLDAGNTGTETAFLTSLKGEKGDTGAAGEKGETGEAGANGSDGADGSDGKSAYQIWLDAGNTGTEADFLKALALDPKEYAAVNLYTQNTFGIPVTITDTDTNIIYRVVTIPSPISSNTSGSILVYLPVDKTYQFSVSEKDGYIKPGDVIVTTVKGVNLPLPINYTGAMLTVNNQTSATVAAKVYVDDILVQDFTLSSYNVRSCICKLGGTYKVESVLDLGEYGNSSFEEIGTLDSDKTVILSESSIETLYVSNASGFQATAKVEDVTNDITLFDGTINTGGYQQIAIRHNANYKVTATIDDGAGTKFAKEGSLSNGSSVQIQKQSYHILLHTPYNYERTYIVRNTDTDTIIATKTVNYYTANTDKTVDIPIGVNYEVTLQSPTDAGFAFAGETYAGKADIPNGYGSDYTTYVSLSYTDAVPMSVNASFYHVAQQPDVPFAIKKKADGSVIYSGTITGNNRYLYYPVPTGIVLICTFGDVVGYTTPEPVEVVASSSANVNANYAYSYLRIRNDNAFAFPYVVVDSDTNATLYGGTVESSYITDYMPVKPGTNYRIDYGTVAGHTAPASDAGTAANYGDVTKVPMYS